MYVGHVACKSVENKTQIYAGGCQLQHETGLGVLPENRQSAISKLEFRQDFLIILYKLRLEGANFFTLLVNITKQVGRPFVHVTAA